ncbi:MAG: 3-dehydroquinate synthase [Bacteroidetes bacterium]|nr:3-dehydroquinate synthase [Bacteroidota bacterium]
MIHIGKIATLLEDILAQKDYSKILVLVDEHIEANCLPLLFSKDSLIHFELIKIPSGEEHKTLDTCQLIWDQFNQHHVDRNAVLINLGGGVICDMGGFAASTYKRGIDFINIPTTILAMVDASYGGKTGINFNGIKNNIGVFKNAIETIIHPVFLQTLPFRELRSGWAEIIKHGLIADRDYFARIEPITELTKITEAAWTEIIRTSIQIKSSIVDQDPEEKGIRKILNFGHTIGHAIESASLKTDQPLLHGEAIAIGMLLEIELSVEHNHFSLEESRRIAKYIKHILKIFARIIGILIQTIGKIF